MVLEAYLPRAQQVALAHHQALFRPQLLELPRLLWQ